MSVLYDEYLDEHLANNIYAYKWLCDHLRDTIGDDILEDASFDIIYGHDNSKYSEDEYAAYDAFFYGANKSYAVKTAFDYAWLHHIHNNPHHWQYWVLVNDDKQEGIKALEMPKKYVIGMICDWWSFSFKTGNLYEIFDWYKEHEPWMKLHKNTKSYVEEILNNIRKELDKEKEELEETEATEEKTE